MPLPPRIGEAITPSTVQPCSSTNSPHLFHSFPPIGFAPHDTAFADRRAAGLELRLDQGHEPGARSGQAKRSGQRQGQADEAHIGDDRRHRLANHCAVERSGVGALQGDDLGVGPELGMELAPADIHGIDFGRAPGDQDVGEAAGRGADVERHPPLGVEAERIERRREFEAAPGNIGAGVGADGQLGASGDEDTRLRLGLARHADAAAPDQVGGLGARRRQPHFNQ